LSREQWLSTGKYILHLLSQIEKQNFKRALKKAHSDEGKPQQDKVDLEDTNAFEIERSVFPSLSNFIEHLDEHLWKSF
jgi:hypothetical protein